ncbi:hypothetical protein OSB04_028805 [Centaurea solstitialis]|uniref:Reverse transcriptase zinc-binding domain-containing protein n=1 Tax=Centaurea solstitialis TaxID=347529 RepID=A0AA38W9M5_9ASTR|nr:hypothetical protein OSB04_028805 [Centaurea solstitialis]
MGHRQTNSGWRGDFDKETRLLLFLFLMVAEGLHYMVEEVVRKRLFKGVKDGKDDINISLLQYADDAVFFRTWDPENLRNLVRLLHCFHSVSGLKINLSKSKLFVIGVEGREVISWARRLGCGSESLPFIYLGLPVGALMSRESSWEVVLEKMRKKLTAWKGKLISFGGRRILVKSVLGSVSLYYFSLFRTSESVLRELEKVRSSFFWGGGEGETLRRGITWVIWDKVLESFKRGGSQYREFKRPQSRPIRQVVVEVSLGNRFFVEESDILKDLVIIVKLILISFIALCLTITKINNEKNQHTDHRPGQPRRRQQLSEPPSGGRMPPSRDRRGDTTSSVVTTIDGDQSRTTRSVVAMVNGGCSVATPPDPWWPYKNQPPAALQWCGLFAQWPRDGGGDLLLPSSVVAMMVVDLIAKSRGNSGGRRRLDDGSPAVAGDSGGCCLLNADHGNGVWSEVSTKTQQSGRVGLRKGAVWSSVIKCGRDLDEMGFSFLDSFGIKLGDGCGTRFWEDRWLPCGRLKERFGRLFALESVKEAKVGERGEFRDGVWHWRWDWRRAPRGRELGELESLYSTIENVKSIVGEKDRVVWFLDPHEGFSVKKLRRCFEEARTSGSENSVIETEWPKSVPKKINILVWRLKLGRIPTRSVLDKLGIDLDSCLCPRCGKEIETIEHAVFTCEKVAPLWEQVGRWWNVDLAGKSSFSEFVAAGQQRGNFSKGFRRWIATVWIFVYLIWSDRNNCVFRNANPMTAVHFTEYQLRVFEWITRREAELKVEMANWLSDPFTS